MPARALAAKTLRTLVEDVPTALAQARESPEQAARILEAVRVAQADLRCLDDWQRDDLVEVALAASVDPDLRGYVARQSDAMKVPRFFRHVVADAGSDAVSLELLREFTVHDDFQIRAMLKSPNIAVRELGARAAIENERFLLVAAATLLHDGSAALLRSLAAESAPGSALREAHALAAIWFAQLRGATDSATTFGSSEAAKALEAVGTTPSWLGIHACLDLLRDAVTDWPCGDLSPLLDHLHRIKITLLTVIDAMRPDLAVPILVDWKPALLLGDDAERLPSLPAFVGLLAQTQRELPAAILAELCAVFVPGASDFHFPAKASEETAEASLPFFLSDVLTGLPSPTPSMPPVSLWQTCFSAELDAVQRRFLEGPVGAVARKLAQLNDRSQARQLFRAWFERVADAEHWDGLVALLAMRSGPICVDAAWLRVSAHMAAVIFSAAWEQYPDFDLVARKDLPEIFARVAASAASASVRGHALARARRCHGKPPTVDDPLVLTIALLESLENGSLRGDELPHVVELFQLRDDELLSARPGISRVGAAALDALAASGTTAGALLERVTHICFAILAAKRLPSHDHHDGARWLIARVWQDDDERRRRLVSVLSAMEPDDIDWIVARMPAALAERIARSGLTPPRLRAQALLHALDSPSFDAKRCDVSDNPETLARALARLKPLQHSNFTAAAKYLLRASINAMARNPPSLADRDEQSSPWFRMRENVRDLVIGRPEFSTFAAEHLAETLSRSLRDFVKNGCRGKAAPVVACWIRAAARLQDPRPLTVLRQHATELASAGIGAATDETVGDVLPSESLAPGVRLILALRQLRRD